MKTIITLFVLLLYSTIINAQIITVDNNLNSAAQYTDLQEAIDDANSGDTLYISGSGTTYGTVVLLINKPLVLIGAGINSENPAEKQTSINNIQFTEDGASGCVFQNLIFSGGINYHDTIDISNIVVRRCKLNSINIASNSYNWLIENNIILGRINRVGGPPYPSDIIIRNNIFYNGSISISNFKFGSIYIYNNLFLGQAGGPLVNLIDVTIKNNIFYYSIQVSGGSLGTTKEHSLIRNNLSFGTNFLFGGPGDDGSNQITDPLFIDGDENFSFLNDYRLQDGSPALTASSSGEEIGIFGGVAPFPLDLATEFFSNPNISIPLITEMEILSSDVPLDGSFEVQLKAHGSN